MSITNLPQDNNNRGPLILAKLIDGQNPDTQGLAAPWAELAAAVAAAPANRTQRNAAFTAALAGMNGNGRAIQEAVFACGPAEELPGDWQEPARTCPPLPESARIDPTIGQGACKWLSDYIEFSRKWSPRAYDGFHAACALWLLSTIGSRRLRYHVGKERYTNLYIALTARTSLYAKSTTAEIALQTLQYLGADWLLAADSATPQKFISDLTAKLPDDYDDMTAPEKERARLRVAMAGQRGWYYDEFGQHIAAMMRDGGFMADFRGLLRRFDDTPPRYEYGSIGRGNEVINRPYLALLANLTPDDLKPFAKRGAGLWGDGFLARFALITPPTGERLRTRFPEGERIIPEYILKPLAAWHRRLNLPTVDIENTLNEKGEKTGRRVNVTPLDPVTLSVPHETLDAFNNYNDGLLDILEQNTMSHDLDGNYARMAEKALRIAALLASLDGKDAITLEYWARAQEIAETWREGLHRLYTQINDSELSENGVNEEKILSLIAKFNTPTVRQLRQYSALSYDTINMTLETLKRAGEIEEIKAGKTKKFCLFSASVENVEV